MHVKNKNKNKKSKVRERDKKSPTDSEIVEHALDLACIIASMNYEHAPYNFDARIVERRERIENRHIPIGA